MSRYQTRYTCQTCAYESPKWMGRCPECEAWDSFVEEVVLRDKQGAGRPLAGGGPTGPTVSLSGPVPITEIEPLEHARLSSGIAEFDRVLGGGFVPGGLVLVGGDPGIGKSTLLTQVAAAVASPVVGASPMAPAPFTMGGPVLYVSGEESAQQIRIRSDRLRAEASQFLVGVETDVGLILRQLETTRPALAIIDSIQTVTDPDIDSTAGSVSQVRACALRLTRYAKASGVPVVLIGHVTKEGGIAGPRVLEHTVDTVLYFEGDRHSAYRLLRAAKNRFGSTDELGIFEMRESGLAGVENPSAVLLAEREEGALGSAVSSVLEGSRALLVEVQALVARSHLASPRRSVTGMDPNRVGMILAVLEKRAGLKLAEQDVFVNVAGGVKVVEPAADLATAMAIASSFREEPVDPHTILIGEIGLGGEVRAVSQADKRVREASRLGFRRAIVSKHNAGRMSHMPGIEIVSVGTIVDAVREALVAERTRE